MLKKTSISKLEIGSDEWKAGRLGKFTSSEVHFLMGDSFWSSGCQTYVYRKVGESITGLVGIQIDSSSAFIPAMEWGLANELEAVHKFGKVKGCNYMVSQQLITAPGSMFGSTPDALIINRESSDELEYDVSTVEVKCPPTYHNYVRLALCRTPYDLKRTCKEYYWQVLDQMLNCEAMFGYFVAYHPDFKEGNMNIIEFRKMMPTEVRDGKTVKFPLVEDLKLLEYRKQMAVQKFNEIKVQISSLGRV